MNKRTELDGILRKILGNNNTYFQPPENLKINYPCIKYKRNNIESKSANDSKYITHTRYQLIVIDKNPDNDIVDKLLELPMSSYESHYTKDGLNHDVITLFY